MCKLKSEKALHYILRKTQLTEEEIRNIYFDYVNNYVIPSVKTEGETNKYSTFKNEHRCFDIIKQLFPEKYELVCYAFRNCLIKSYFQILNRNALQKKEDFDPLIFNRIFNFKVHKLQRLIGVGGNGFVLLNGDKVIKVFFTKIGKSNLVCLRLGSKNHPYFPKVFHIIHNIVVEEKLQTKTPKCYAYNKFIGRTSVNSLYYTVLKDRNLYKKKKWTDEQREMLIWLANIFNTKAKEKHKNIYDIRIENLGERDNGEIVLFDP